MIFFQVTHCAEGMMQLYVQF